LFRFRTSITPIWKTYIPFSTCFATKYAETIEYCPTCVRTNIKNDPASSNRVSYFRSQNSENLICDSYSLNLRQIISPGNRNINKRDAAIAWDLTHV
jgi:hypothetical protein